MRIGLGSPAVLLLVGLAVGGCSSDSVGLTPTGTGVASASSVQPTALPTISEDFTLLPCPSHANTTLQLEGCAEHQIVRLDAKINQRSQAVLASLHSAAAKQHFVAAQQDWDTYRRAACLSESDLYAGGTLGPVAFANCEVRINRARLDDLAALQTP